MHNRHSIFPLLVGTIFALLAVVGCSPAESPEPQATATSAEATSSSATATSTAGIDEETIQALEWRNIGPFNGGRGTTVVGHPTDPMVFWFGHSSGGLWKTEDAGAYWDKAPVPCLGRGHT